MKLREISFAGAVSLLFCMRLGGQQGGGRHEIARLSDGIVIYSQSLSDGKFGLCTVGATKASSVVSLPVRVELKDSVSGQRVFQQGYDRIIEGKGDSFRGESVLAAGGVSFLFLDSWQVSSGALHLDRTVRVQGTATGGFMSAFTFSTPTPWVRNDVDVFIPGMVYGTVESLSPGALGGRDTYTLHHGIVRIREDRMPAPLIGVYFKDGSAMTLFDDAPKAGSTLADSNDAFESNDVQLMTDARFQFGALGEDESVEQNPDSRQAGSPESSEAASKHSPIVGYWMPGTEGEMTYGSNARGVIWRRRFHPLQDGFVQHYKVTVSFDESRSFPDYMTAAWRRAWLTLNPPVLNADIPVVKESIIQMLEGVAVHGEGGTGLPFFVDASRGDLIPEARFTLMGFLGRNMQAADMLLYESEHDGAQSAQLHTLAVQILDSFAKLKMSPPEGHGFWLDSGEPVGGDIALRSPSEDLYYMLSAWKREHAAGRDHPLWLARPKEFADWLLGLQGQDGGFPRSWRRNSNTVVADSEMGSHNPIALFAELTEVTGDPKYLAAAERAGDWSWSHGQSDGVFAGGVERNPAVIDKEAATLSLNAYLHLYEATHDRKWLERAKAAGDDAETWIYLWNVEMPVDANDAQLPWKKGVPTVGLQLINTGESGADEYMSGDVANYARLYKYTGDKHYFAVAKVLLRDTKSMMALPGRTYDLVGPGWQQESWGLSIPRNFMDHRVWLPWISVCQLGGIVQTEEFDPMLFSDLEK